MTPAKGANQVNLQARALYCERDDRQLFADLSFSVCSGDLLQLVGPNGAGKTTLLRLLAGLNHDYTGDVTWHDQPLHQVYSEYAHQRLYLGHLSAVKKSLTPLENLRWLMASEAPNEDQLWVALKEAGLVGYEETPCQHLSAGQQRRVALARLCITQLPLWILDEPFTALDKAGVAWLEQKMQQQVSRGGAVIITSHHALEAVHGLRQLTLGGAV
jgi:heme exporter protein A